MNPSVLSSTNSDGLDSLALVRQLVLEKENSKFKSALFYLRIELVLHPDGERKVG